MMAILHITIMICLKKPKHLRINHLTHFEESFDGLIQQK